MGQAYTWYDVRLSNGVPRRLGTTRRECEGNGLELITINKAGVCGARNPSDTHPPDVESVRTRAG
jgi:hypothetical protein